MPQANSSKTETKTKKDRIENMPLVLKKWGLTIDTVELEIGNQSMRDLNGEDLNIYCSNLFYHACLVQHEKM